MQLWNMAQSQSSLQRHHTRPLAQLASQMAPQASTRSPRHLSL
jgi:hypothetical protein